MVIERAESYGFCFGVKRAIKIAEEHKGSITYGPLIHNKDEIKRLKEGFNIGLAERFEDITKEDSVVIRTHGIPKQELEILKRQNNLIIDATCPYVTTPQQIVQNMSSEGYDVVVFGDADHPEIKGVISYVDESRRGYVVADCSEVDSIEKLGSKVAVVAQTTRKPHEFQKVVSALLLRAKEVRAFNTICNATFQNQDAAAVLAKRADVMIIIGGKHSSNTKQLHKIASEFCQDSYLIENSSELLPEWFEDKKLCGISAGASTPEWIVNGVVEAIEALAK